MVVISTISDPVPPPVEWIAARGGSQVLLTIDDVEAMVKAGIVPEDATTELLHGVLLHVDRSDGGEDPLAIGDEHAFCVEAFSDLRIQINNSDRHVRTQQPLVCSDTNSPQPDFFVLRGSRRENKGRVFAANATCVVEVADSSYQRDAGEKLFGYARACVPQYIIINLRNRTAEVYVNPGTYSLPVIVTQTQELQLRVGEAEFFSVPLADLLP
jgi:hypothetical protein